MAESPRARHLRTKYGLTEAAFKRLEDMQEGTCAICHKRPKGRLQVDHDHKSGEIRGLLCWRENKGLDYNWTREKVLSAYHYLDPNNWTGLFVPPKKRRKPKKS